MSKQAPQYIKIAQDIIEKIQDGTLQSGDKIMTEMQLCSLYGVSRMTVNKALSTLASDGYVSRIAGKGTFVLEPRVTKFIGDKGSFSNDIRSIGKVPGAILINYEVIRASTVKQVREKLELNDDALVHHITRVRTSDDIRIALSHTYIPVKHLQALDVTVLEGSLYEYLDQEYNLHPSVLDYSFSAILPSEAQKNLLSIESCALFKSRTYQFC